MRSSYRLSALFCLTRLGCTSNYSSSKSLQIEGRLLICIPSIIKLLLSKHQIDNYQRLHLKLNSRLLFGLDRQLMFTMKSDLRNRDLTEVFELKVKEDEYVVVMWLPGDYLQVVLIDVQKDCLRDKVMRYRELDEEFRVYFRNMQELFNAFKVSTAITLQYSKDSNDVVVTLKVIQRLLRIKLRSREQEQVKNNDSKANIDQISKSYKEKLIEVCDQNKRLAIEIKNRQQLITQLQIQMGLVKVNYEEMAIKMGRIQHQLKQRSYHERRESAYVTQMQQNTTYKIPLTSIQFGRTVQTINRSSRFVFKAYANQFLKNFKIEGTKIKLQKQYKDFYQVCSESPLPQQGRVIIAIQILHTKTSNIYFGLMKQSRRKEKFTCQHKEAISYKLKGGKFLYQDGYQTGEEIPYVRQNEVLSLLVDNETSQVSWTLEEKYMIKRKLPQNMQKCPLYVFVSLHDEGDEVELK